MKETDFVSQALILFCVNETKATNDMLNSYGDKYYYHLHLLVFFLLIRQINIKFPLKIDFDIDLSWKEVDNIESAVIRASQFEEFYRQFLVSGRFLDRTTGLLTDEGKRIYQSRYEDIIKTIFSEYWFNKAKGMILNINEALKGMTFVDLISTLKQSINKKPDIADKKISETLKYYSQSKLSRRYNFRLIHLSDIHITEDIRNNEINKLLDLISYNIKDPIDAILISGDGINKGGTVEKYERLDYFIRQCSERLLRSPARPQFNRIMYLPGNHDLDRDMPRMRYKLDCCKDMIRETYSDGNDIKNIIEEYNWTIPISYPEKPIKGMLFSSAFNYKKFDFGFVELGTNFANCMVRLKKDEGTKFEVDNFKFACLHHHVIPVNTFTDLDMDNLVKEESNSETPELDLSITVNSSKILKELMRNGFKLLFHGHAHNPFSKILENRHGNRLCIVGCGSLNAPKEELHPDFKYNSFNIVTIDPVYETVSVQVMRKSPYHRTHFEKCGEEYKFDLKTRKIESLAER